MGTSAWYAPGAAAAEMVEAILKDKKAILPCSVFLQGEYGVTRPVPRRAGEAGRKGGGADHRNQAHADENAALMKSAAAVKELTTVIGV